MSRTTLPAIASAWLSVVLFLAGSGCTPEPPGPDGLFDGIEDIIASAPPISTFDGEWLSTQYGYAVEITSRTGVATLSNSAYYAAGDSIIAIVTDDGPRFSGRHVFSNGSIVDVIGTLVDPNTILLAGGGVTWTLSRFNAIVQNVPPEAQSRVVFTTKDAPVAIVLSGIDPDNGPSPLSYALQSPPTNGSLTGSPPTVVYTPNGGFVGNDVFTFSVTDGEDVAFGNVSVLVLPP